MTPCQRRAKKTLREKTHKILKMLSGDAHRVCPKKCCKGNVPATNVRLCSLLWCRMCREDFGLSMPHRDGREYVNSQISYVYVLASPGQLLRKTESSELNMNDSEAKGQVASLHSLMNSSEVTWRF